MTDPTSPNAAITPAMTETHVESLSKQEHSRLTQGRNLIWLIALVVWIIDQATKALVVRNLPFGTSWAPIPALADLFQFTHTTNTGMAFGLFPDGGLFFVIVAFAVIGLGMLYYRHLPTDRWLVRVALGLQLGGALGNLTDRLIRGSVVDFVDVGPWWIFNVADSCIVVGVAILAYYLLTEEQP